MAGRPGPRTLLARVMSAVLVAGAVLLAVTPAAAQCAMCGLSAQQAADPGTVNRTFGAAVLVLIVPVLGMLGALAGVTWKARHWDGAIFDPDDDTHL